MEQRRQGCECFDVYICESGPAEGIQAGVVGSINNFGALASIIINFEQVQIPLPETGQGCKPWRSGNPPHTVDTTYLRQFRYSIKKRSGYVFSELARFDNQRQSPVTYKSYPLPRSVLTKTSPKRRYSVRDFTAQRRCWTPGSLARQQIVSR